MAFTFGANRRVRPRGAAIAAVDVGTTKVCCLIARADDNGRLRVVGAAQQASQGLRSGVIVDMEAAGNAIGQAVHSAEHVAGVEVRDVVVNVSGAHLVSQTVPAEVALGPSEVGEAHLRRALAQARAGAGAGEPLHAIPVGYDVDDNRGVRDPRGMFAQTLGVQVHLVTGASGPMRNLHACIARNHLNVEAAVASPYASGLACLVEDEKDLGSVVIDMGGGTTSLAVFFDGHCVHTESVSVGGTHVTNDIARGLTTPVAHAERMKTLHGCAMASAADEREMIDVPQVGEEEAASTNQVPKSLLVGIIQPRLEEVFELVRERLERSGFGKVAGRRVVLTGGASQMPGTRELASLILDKQVRLGKPVAIGGLTDSLSGAQGGPAMATCAGLLIYSLKHLEETGSTVAESVEANGFLGRLTGWFRENF